LRHARQRTLFLIPGGNQLTAMVLILMHTSPRHANFQQRGSDKVLLLKSLSMVKDKGKKSQDIYHNKNEAGKKANIKFDVGERWDLLIEHLP
jgi:hypothetical protein